MRHLRTSLIVFCILIFCTIQVFGTELSDRLSRLDDVVSVTALPTTKLFSEKYLVVVSQYLDASAPERGRFNQRVIVSHRDFSAPVVYITEGYAAEYALNERYINELTDFFDANQICVEHRYFAESCPDSIDWTLLTTRNAAADHHHICELLKTIYTGKWMSTGISKGGETCLLYRMYYPTDVDITVAYVSPVARALYDGRHEPFIDKIGTEKDRNKITVFQKEVLKRKQRLLPKFRKFIDDAKLEFQIPVDEIFDYCVLEFNFAYWQWYNPSMKLPTKKDSDDKLLQYLLAVSGPDYFSSNADKDNRPFFYQAARELGYYGYETRHLKKYLSITSAEHYFERIFLTADMGTVEFLPETSQRLEKFIRTKADHTFIILGEYDPWTAVAPEAGDNQGVIRVVCPRGSHTSRIKSLPKPQHDFVIKTINSWLK